MCSMNERNIAKTDQDEDLEVTLWQKDNVTHLMAIIEDEPD